MKVRLFCFFLLASCFSSNIFSQAVDYSGDINFTGLASGGDELPFWMYSNQRGRIYEDTNFSGLITGIAHYGFYNGDFFEAGGGLLYQDGHSPRAFADELYLHFETHWFAATAGRKQHEIHYNGLSASNENILWSLNATPPLGLQLRTTAPLFFLPESENGLFLEASWSEYYLGKGDGYYENVRLHHKSVSVGYLSNIGLEVKAGLQHFAHWGGFNPYTGEERPTAMADYMDAVVPESPAQHHLTSYEFYLKQAFRDFSIELLYNHLAVDLTGRRFGNFPDGRYGIFIESREKDQPVNSVIYELYYTHNQSYQSSSGIEDNYFNHHVYRSGWAYRDKILGAPFFLYDKETDRVINNKFMAHHVGIGGQFSTWFKTYPYRLLMSFSRNDGIYPRRYRPEQNVFATYLDMKIVQNFIHINLQIGTEYRSDASPNYGIGVQVKKNIF